MSESKHNSSGQWLDNHPSDETRKAEWPTREPIAQPDGLAQRILEATAGLEQESVMPSAAKSRDGWIHRLFNLGSSPARPRLIGAASVLSLALVVTLIGFQAPLLSTNTGKGSAVVMPASMDADAELQQLYWDELLLLQDEIAFAEL